MRFLLTLIAIDAKPIVPINYQYPISAAIYKIINNADAAYAFFLHEKGYGSGHHNFKLFTFSDLTVPFKIDGDRMLLQSPKAELTLCFHVPQAAENFIRGLFLQQQIEIADRESRAVFTVQQIESLPMPVLNAGLNKVLLEPMSPIVVGRKADNGHYNYRSPTEEDFTDCIRHNLLEKHRSITNATDAEIDFLKQQIFITVQLNQKPPQERRPIIKAGTPEQTKLRGYTKFGIEMIAPKGVIELGLNVGLGLYNSTGQGAVRNLLKQHNK